MSEKQDLINSVEGVAERARSFYKDIRESGSDVLENVPDKDVWKNEPLTLDELRQMDGEPVWVVWPDGRIKSQWFIISSTFWIEMFQEWDGTLSKDYGKTWLAYRKKPEEGTV